MDFTLDAFISGSRWRHHRTRDHFGAESDLHVVLSEDMGPYPMDTPIRFVIEDLITRLNALENGTRVRDVLTLDAWISGQVITLNAILRKEASDGFFLNAWVGQPFHSFTLDAFLIPADGSFTLDAYLV